VVDTTSRHWPTVKTPPSFILQPTLVGSGAAALQIKGGFYCRNVVPFQYTTNVGWRRRRRFINDNRSVGGGGAASYTPIEIK
jgi:hypothetical protein